MTKTAEHMDYPVRVVIKASLVYLGLVFAAGFVLGTVRVLLLVPQLGERYAELLELPLMILISYFAARFVVARFNLRHVGQCVLIGALSLVLLLALELTMVLAVRGLSIQDYIAGRDPVSASAYLLSLLAYALMPVLLARRNPHR